MKRRIIRNYNYKMKQREWKALIKNYKVFFLAIILLLIYSFFKIFELYVSNRGLIIDNAKYIIWSINTAVLFITLFNKKYPLNIHPSNMIFFSEKDFKKFFIKEGFQKKSIFYAIISLFLNVFLEV